MTDTVWKRARVHFREDRQLRVAGHANRFAELRGLAAVEGAWVHLRPENPEVVEMCIPMSMVQYIEWEARSDRGATER